MQNLSTPIRFTSEANAHPRSVRRLSVTGRQTVLGNHLVSQSARVAELADAPHLGSKIIASSAIGIGGAVTHSPCHTTVHAVRIQRRRKQPEVQGQIGMVRQPPRPGHRDYRRSAPQGQFRCSVGAIEQTAPPNLASIASRSRFAACAGSTDQGPAAPRFGAP